MNTEQIKRANEIKCESLELENLILDIACMRYDLCLKTNSLGIQWHVTPTINLPADINKKCIKFIEGELCDKLESLNLEFEELERI